MRVRVRVRAAGVQLKPAASCPADRHAPSFVLLDADQGSPSHTVDTTEPLAQVLIIGLQY